MILSDKTLRDMILDVGLVQNYIDLDTQLQPNGFDLTVNSIEVFRSAGSISFEDKQIPRMIELSQTTTNDQWRLHKGAYFVRFNERVHLPIDVMAFGRPRSSLLRSGVAMHTAVWDAGYNGQSGSLLVVYNDDGYYVQKNARLLQLVFSTLDTAVAQAYQGSYQFEGISK